MDAVLLKLLRSRGSQRVGDDAGRARRETAGRNLDDLAAIDLADDALDQHLLRLIAVAHERAVLLEQVGEAVGAERDAALIRDVGVTEGLHALQEQGVGVARGRLRGVDVATGRSGGGEGLENVRVILQLCSARFATPRSMLSHLLHISMQFRLYLHPLYEGQPISTRLGVLSFEIVVEG